MSLYVLTKSKGLCMSDSIVRFIIAGHAREGFTLTATVACLSRVVIQTILMYPIASYFFKACFWDFGELIWSEESRNKINRKNIELAYNWGFYSEGERNRSLFAINVLGIGILQPKLFLAFLMSAGQDAGASILSAVGENLSFVFIEEMEVWVPRWSQWVLSFLM